MQTQTSSILHNDTVSSFSTSNVQEKTQLSRSRCMHSLGEVKKQFKFLSETLQDFGTMPIFKRTFSQDLDLLEQHLTKDILSQTDCKTTLKNLRTKFENAFNSEFKERMHKYTRFDAQSFKDAMICTMDSIGKCMLKIILPQQRTLHLLKQKKLMQTQEDHSNPIRALNVDSLKVYSVVIPNPCSEIEDCNSETASNKYFVEYTGIEVKHFRDTLLQHMGNVKKSVFERARHQRQYDRRVNKRLMQTQERNDTDADDADIRPIYDKEPMATVQLTVACNIFAIGKHHTEQPEIINEGQHGQVLNDKSNKAKIKKEIDVLETINIELEHKVANFRKENKTLKKHYKYLYDSIKITRSKNIEQTTSLLANNAALKAQIPEKVFAIAALKNDLRKLKGNSVDTKFANTSVLGKPVVQPLRNQSVVRQSNAFKNERHQISNDMVHNHYLDKAKKKTQERDRNLKTSVMTPARFQSTADDSKPKPRSTNHSYRSLPISKSSCVTITAMPKADHSKSPKHTFSPNKTSAMYEKISPRSDLRWKPTGRIFKYVGLRWLPTGKLFDSCTSKVESKPPHGSNVDISKIHECKQTLDLSAGTSINVPKEQSLVVSAVQPRNIMSTEVPSTDTIVMTSMIELESLFDPSFDEYSDGENRVVSKPSAVTTADTSDKRQQQPDSTSSLATTVTADGNFDL
uniref:Integrase, catalytic region, zinc finger, CCHC-type, peptidase aspartic, catalytic n=1 Tax=Tanacetum cinerariifolium TaxID=118510 RepID=A0A6L2MCQ3_TANCI|nr:hypothetical protein [Tanacetum cinerariifolium]